MPIPLNVLLVSVRSHVGGPVCEALATDGFAPRCLQISSPDAVGVIRSDREWDVALIDLMASAPGAKDVLRAVRSAGFRRPVIALVCDMSDASRLLGEFIDDVDASVPMNDLGRLGAAIRRYLPYPASPLESAGSLESAADAAGWGTGNPVVREVNKLIFMEEALRQSEELFREIAENIHEVFFVRDLQRDRMIYVSPSYERMWGRPRNLLYKDPADFLRYVHPDDGERVATEHGRQDERHPFNLEFRILLPDDTVRWMWARTFPVRDQTGKAYRLAYLVEDITSRKFAEHSRLEAEKFQRDTLIREVHHRIKNNLQGVVGLLRQHAIEHPEVTAPLEGAISRVNAIAMVHGLQGREAGDGVRLCDMVEAICRAAADLTGVSVKPELERVLARPVLLSQKEAVPIALTVNELVFNAVKHSGHGAARAMLRVMVDHDGACAWVRIANLGARLPSGFDFAAGDGLGTGLTLVKSLLPRAAASLSIHEDVRGVVALLELQPPNVTLM